MTELEKRLAAVELALGEIAPWIDADKIADAVASIKAGLFVQVSEDEAEIRLQAIELLTDGKRRFEPFSAGAWVRTG
jgi:uncharacterized protein YpuA (DUF1002 family)